MTTSSWEYAGRTKLMNPIDDEFFRKMAEDPEFCQEILQVILGDRELVIEEVIPQDAIKNLQGRSVVLDALCRKCDGSYCHVEVQKSNDDDHIRRVRYNSSCITTNIVDVGSRFENVPDVYVIYISKSDFLHTGLTICHVDNVIRETKEVVDDGLYRVFVNATVKDGSDVSELMDIFTESNKYNYEKFPKTSERKRTFKERKEGQQEMSDIVREICEEVEAKSERKRRIVDVELVQKNLGLDLPQACAAFGMTVEEYEEMKSLLKNEE